MNKDNEPRRSVLNVVLDHLGRSAAAFAALSGVATAAVASLVGCGTDMVVPKVFCLFLVANLCVWTVICEALLVSIHRGRHRPDSIRRYGNTSLAMVLCGVAVGVCVACAVFTAVPGWDALDSIWDSVRSASVALVACSAGALAVPVIVLALMHVAGSDDGGA